MTDLRNYFKKNSELTFKKVQTLNKGDLILWLFDMKVYRVAYRKEGQTKRCIVRRHGENKAVTINNCMLITKPIKS